MHGWEAVVVDDASDPPISTQELKARFGGELKVIRHDTSKGGPASKNDGADAARGDLIAFLDDDDLYAPSYLERAVDALSRHPEVDVVFMGVDWFGAASDYGRDAYNSAMDRTLSRAHGVEIEPNLIRFGHSLFPALLHSVPMAFQRPVVRKSAFQRIGRYRPDCFLWDCEWALLAARASSTLLLNLPLYRQRVDGQGLSSKRDRRLDGIRSGLDISLRLLDLEQRTDASSWRIRPLRQGVARAYDDLARYMARTGQPTEALKAWVCGQRKDFNLGRFKLLAHILLSAAGARRR